LQFAPGGQRVVLFSSLAAAHRARSYPFAVSDGIYDSLTLAAGQQGGDEDVDDCHAVLAYNRQAFRFCVPGSMFSVLMPVHNAGAYLEKSIRSVINQTFLDWELILVDDGSTDGAVGRLNVHDSRIRIFRQDRRNAAAASNAALREARRPLVALLDQDDLWAPTKLARHFESFTGYDDLDFNFTWSHFIGPTDERLALPARTWHGRVSFGLLVRDFVIGSTSSVAFRRDAAEAINGFDLSLPFMYDFDLILRLAALRPNNGIAIEEDLCAYRRHNRQMSRNWRLLREDWDRLMAGLLDHQGLTDGDRIRGQRNMVRYFSFLAYESRQIGPAAQLWWQSFRTEPVAATIDRRTWKMAAAIVAATVLPARTLRLIETRRARSASRANSVCV
jgi:glycosyltransferase involved in cell wall biosynthesis